jgi:ABC-type transporter Mla subunit MlaD
MKKTPVIILMALVLLTLIAAAGCTTSYATSDQVMSLQSQVNSLTGQLNSTQQQLVSTQQQLASAQQQLSSVQQAQSQLQQQQQQQRTYTTTAQPVYPNTYYQTYPYIYQTYPYTPWNQYPRPYPYPRR